MKHAAFLLLAALLLVGCETLTEQPPGAARIQASYEQSPIEPDRWRLSFGRGLNLSAQVVGAALLQHAADLTLSQGYDGFRITERFTEPSGRGAGVVGKIEIMMVHGRTPVGDPDAFDAHRIRRAAEQST
jgi:hypothetical protein